MTSIRPELLAWLLVWFVGASLLFFDGSARDGRPGPGTTPAAPPEGFVRVVARLTGRGGAGVDGPASLECGAAIGISPSFRTSAAVGPEGSLAVDVPCDVLSLPSEGPARFELRLKACGCAPVALELTLPGDGARVVDAGTVTLEADGPELVLLPGAGADVPVVRGVEWSPHLRLRGDRASSWVVGHTRRRPDGGLDVFLETRSLSGDVDLSGAPPRFMRWYRSTCTAGCGAATLPAERTDAVLVVGPENAAYACGTGDALRRVPTVAYVVDVEGTLPPSDVPRWRGMDLTVERTETATGTRLELLGPDEDVWLGAQELVPGYERVPL